MSPSFSPGAAYVELPESILDVDGQAALALGEIDPDGLIRDRKLRRRLSAARISASDGNG